MKNEIIILLRYSSKLLEAFTFLPGVSPKFFFEGGLLLLLRELFLLDDNSF